MKLISLWNTSKWRNFNKHHHYDFNNTKNTEVLNQELASAVFLQAISQALIFVTRSRDWYFTERRGLLLVSAFIIAQLIATLISIEVIWKFAGIHKHSTELDFKMMHSWTIHNKAGIVASRNLGVNSVIWMLQIIWLQVIEINNKTNIWVPSLVIWFSCWIGSKPSSECYFLSMISGFKFSVSQFIFPFTFLASYLKFE